MFSLNLELIILFIVNIISHLVNIPFKMIAYFDSALKQFKDFSISALDEIKKTGEFTVEFKIKRELHGTPITAE